MFAKTAWPTWWANWQLSIALKAGTEEGGDMFWAEAVAGNVFAGDIGEQDHFCGQSQSKSWEACGGVVRP